MLNLEGREKRALLNFSAAGKLACIRDGE